MSSTLRQVIANVIRDPELSRADREHLKRWTAYGDDILWEKLETDVEACGLLPTGTTCETVIRHSLTARRFAMAAKLGDDPLFEEKKRQRDTLLELAGKAEALAKYFAEAEKFSGIAMFFQRYLKPVSELQDLHNQEAVLLRQSAGRPPKPTAFISRQSGGKGRRFYSRQYNAFMSFMTDHMCDISGKPHHDVVAIATNIAFLQANVTADNVRAVFRAPKRRRRSTQSHK